MSYELLDDARKIELVEWLTTPPHLRGQGDVPKSMEALADKLGVTSRTLRNWKNDKVVRQVWEKEARSISGDPERKQRVLEELYDIALDRADTKQMKAADLWLKAVGAITPPVDEAEQGSKAATSYTDEELDAMIREEAAKKLQERQEVTGGR